MLKRSTREFFKLHGWKNFKDFIHGYIYARFPNWYLEKLRKAGRKGGRNSYKSPQSRHLEERYHSKVLTTRDAQKIIHLDKPIEVENPERVIPFEIANRIVLETPGKVAVINCPCRETKGDNACGPKDVCMIVGEPFVDFVVEHNTNSARMLARDEASDILKKSADRGWVHTAWFKDAMGGRFYAICNCCSCCCMPMGAMQASFNRAKYVTPSGYVAILDGEMCAGCGSCVEICQFRALRLRNGEVIINPEKCYGCGVCEHLCTNGAVTMVLDQGKELPFDLDVIV